MTGEKVARSFVSEKICYWVIYAGDYESWSSAADICAEQAGSAASIASDAENMGVAQNLYRYGRWGEQSQS